MKKYPPCFGTVNLCLSLFTNLFVPLLFFVSLATQPVVAKEITFSDSINKSVNLNESSESLLKKYDLDKEEWEQYKEVLKGPRGLWSPNIHPVMALGMRKGISDTERKKLAIKMAKIRYARVKRELAFEKAVREEGLKLYGHLPLFVDFNGTITPAKDTARTALSTTADKKQIIQLFSDLNCAACKLYIEEWISKDQPFELYVVGDKSSISKFAQTMGISPLLVPSKIKINQVSKRQLRNMGITELPQIRRLVSK